MSSEPWTERWTKTGSHNRSRTVQRPRYTVGGYSLAYVILIADRVGQASRIRPLANCVASFLEQLFQQAERFR